PRAKSTRLVKNSADSSWRYLGLLSFLFPLRNGLDAGSRRFLLSNALRQALFEGIHQVNYLTCFNPLSNNRLRTGNLCFNDLQQRVLIAVGKLRGIKCRGVATDQLLS